jgi:NAD(P)-dependent dehydrogenase (short-subunit alcohol dehydrogenase family)
MANYALAETQYFCGDLGAFRAAAERALALNSRCSYTMAHLGLLFCFSDIASVATFLASDASCWVIGETIRVEGGAR